MSRAPLAATQRSCARAGPATATTPAAAANSRLARKRVDAGGTMLRLRALHVMGHGPTRIARAIGASEQVLIRIVRGDTYTVTLALRDAVAEVYDAWWDKRAPERTRADRVAVSAARRRAQRGNWCAGAALDDDQLDVPRYQPRHGWRPARGTGVAAPPLPAAGKDIA